MCRRSPGRLLRVWLRQPGRDARAAESARLESVCGATHRGFESHSLRHSDLNGLTAHNEAVTRGTFRAPADQAKIELLSEITCGDLTLDRDGVSDSSG